MLKGLVKLVPETTKSDAQTRHTYISPAQYHFDRYYTQDPAHKLFKAMRNAIRKRRTILTLGGNVGLWEVDGEFLFITDKNYAKRAQLILAKAASRNYPNFMYTAYFLCSDLK